LLYVFRLLLYLYLFYSFFFFFQAEDGIRDRNVTGVQTCALPIFFRLKDVDPLDIALGAEELFLNADGQLHAVRMYIRKPHFHMDSHSFSKICNLTANVSLLY